jgi:D-beta-D-heptose 7-phosphate kinase/D-beta-D-heptose 1-phosphate adenosyltransferase
MGTSVPDFTGLRVAVVGDLIADHYLYARPTRLSREAPVMVLSHKSESVGAGGAANVARNLRALGAKVRIFGVTGRDTSGRELVRLLEAQGIDTAGLELLAGWTTPTKTRILAAEPRRSLQQVLRIDREPSTPADVNAARHRRTDPRARRLDRRPARVGLRVRDGVQRGRWCGEGSQRERRALTGPARGVVESFAGITAVTPNMGELARFANLSTGRSTIPGASREVAASFRERLRVRWLLVTCGNRGMALFGEGIDPEGLAVEASGTGEVTDVCGAGDTAAAVFALALASGLEASQSMVLANAAAGVVCMEHGAAVCTPPQLRAALPAAPPAHRLGRTSYA